MARSGGLITWRTAGSLEVSREHVIKCPHDYHLRDENSPGVYFSLEKLITLLTIARKVFVVPDRLIMQGKFKRFFWKKWVVLQKSEIQYTVTSKL